MKKALLLLLAQVVALSTVVAAVDTKTTVKLDGKTVFVPEIKLSNQVNPVDTFLYVGSWSGKDSAPGKLDSFCALDLKNNSIRIKSPEKLLKESKTTVLNQENSDPVLDKVWWGRSRTTTQFVFNAQAGRRQPAVLELFTDDNAVVFNNGKKVGRVLAAGAVDAGGRGYVPIIIEYGKNIISIKQSALGKPRLQANIYLDHSRDLQAAWQNAEGGLLKKLVHPSKGIAGIPVLDWTPRMGNFTVGLEVRDVATNNIVLKKESAGRGRLVVGGEAPDGEPQAQATDGRHPDEPLPDDVPDEVYTPPLDGAGADASASADQDEVENAAVQNFAPGIYEITYRARDESASEFFVVGNPPDLFAELQDKLSKHSPNAESKLNIEAQLRRARILLAKDNYNPFDRQWQEKFIYTLSSLTTFERRLKEGVTNIAKDQPGLHIRSFISKVDGSSQFYRLFVPSSYKPGTPMPLLVCVSTRISNSTRPFIEGPVIANHREALLWAKYAEKHGFALLWPGYKSVPEGYSYESANSDEAIQAVEIDYCIDRKRVSVYATCGAGYNAGRLVSEYDNRFAAIVYDRAVFDLTLRKGQYPSSVIEWLEAINPIPRVLENRNLKIFVMHDNTKPAGHGQMKLTKEFLKQAKGKRDDVVSHLSRHPTTEASRMDKVFTWLAPCRNENPDNKRSHFLAKAGYNGPILEIFATPVIVVVGSHASTNRDQENIQLAVEALAAGHEKYFHGAKCVVKIDDDVTQDDMKNHSLILIGNPKSNSVWEKLQSRIPLDVTSEKVLYKNATLTEKHAFQAIVRNPDAADKYVLLVGASDLQQLRQVTMDDTFRAWYDCIVFANPSTTIGKLDAPRETQKPDSPKKAQEAQK